jgi:hypothetical protein
VHYNCSRVQNRGRELPPNSSRVKAGSRRSSCASCSLVSFQGKAVFAHEERSGADESESAEVASAIDFWRLRAGPRDERISSRT